MEGWIQLHRKLTEWEWYKDVNTFKVFMHLILCANHKDANWRGQKIKRGQLIRSLNSLSHETGLSVKQIRTAINKLKKTGEVASEGTSKNTVFTIIGYDLYQSQESKGKQKGKQGASEGQAKGKQGATDNNDNNYNTENNEENLTNPSGKPTVSQEDVDYIYSLYPTRCTAKDRSTGKGGANKNKIKQLLKGKETVESLEAKISWYLKDKGRTGYLSNFGTFLNNLPDEEEVMGDSQGRKQEVNDVIDYMIKTQNVTAEQVEAVYRKITEKKIKWSEKPELLKLIFEYGNF